MTLYDHSHGCHVGSSGGVSGVNQHWSGGGVNAGPAPSPPTCGETLTALSNCYAGMVNNAFQSLINVMNGQGVKLPTPEMLARFRNEMQLTIEAYRAAIVEVEGLEYHHAGKD